MTKCIVSVTGHRAWKDREWEKTNLLEGTARLLDLVQSASKVRLDFTLIHGCATGVDLWFGEAAMKLELPLELYLPFPRITQIVKGKMTPLQAESLNHQIEYADKVVVVNKKFFYHGYERRNWALVDRCHLLASYYTRSRSGSGNAVRRAEKKGKPVVDLRKIVETNYLPKNVHNIELLGGVI